MKIKVEYILEMDKTELVFSNKEMIEKDIKNGFKDWIKSIKVSFED